jgi:hypothetical protein
MQITIADIDLVIKQKKPSGFVKLLIDFAKKVPPEQKTRSAWQRRVFCLRFV